MQYKPYMVRQLLVQYSPYMVGQVLMLEKQNMVGQLHMQYKAVQVFETPPFGGGGIPAM